ncbi:unnamed protein product [Dibothriocephalus latus]|uniref:Uncharacterized protein n=1 Tax=Dibothriocephalus latus TaxID=60516 RepID=A0A3P7LIS6_DIBLA|nr:unnamed protein product [Dibothriocephalus latus]
MALNPVHILVSPNRFVLQTIGQPPFQVQRDNLDTVIFLKICCSCFLDNGSAETGAGNVTLEISSRCSGPWHAGIAPAVLFIPLVPSGVCICPRGATNCRHLFAHPSLGVCFDERLIFRPVCEEDLPFDPASSRLWSGLFLIVGFLVAGVFVGIVIKAYLRSRGSLPNVPK